MQISVLTIPTDATINDYVRVDFTFSPASTDAADLLASDLADIGYESFEPTADGTAMTAYVPAPTYDAAALAEAVDASLIDVVIEADAEFVPGQDWNSEWEKNYFKPIVVADRVVVHSTFHTDVPTAEFDIVIDPRMAFGTGHHATTTLMMQWLLSSGNLSGKTVIDMGTGTGILAMLAAMLGAAKVTAIEIDPFAADNARDNVALNMGESSVITIVTADAAALAPLTGTADVFLANINRNIITADITAYVTTMAQGGILVVSGFYVSDRPVVRSAAEAAGLEYVGAAERDNWSSMTFRKP